MANTKKYYWLKLKEDFFRDKPIKKLRRIAGGDTYTIIYLKLMLMSLREGGNLFFEGLEDTFAEELALDLDEDPDNVRFTLLFLIESGLLEEVNENQMLLTRMPEMTGSETEKAELMRKSRAKEKALIGNDVTTMLPRVTKSYPEIDIEKETDKEKRDRSITRHKYGEYKNVLLSDEDLSKLKAEFSDWEERIERLSSYIASTGKKYKSHLATIRNWARNEKPKVDRDYGDPEDFYK